MKYVIRTAKKIMKIDANDIYDVCSQISKAKDSIVDTIQSLIDDEIEAIDGYNKALDEITDENIRHILEHIRDEEIEHKEELESILEMR